MTDTLRNAIGTFDEERIDEALGAELLIDIHALAKALSVPVSNVQQMAAISQIAKETDKRVLFSFEEVRTICHMIAAATMVAERGLTEEEFSQMIAEDTRFETRTDVVGEEIVKPKKPS